MPKLYTRTGFATILRKIMETGGLTKDMADDMKKLMDDFDEREGMLKRYGEVYNGEDREDYDYTPSDADRDAKRRYDDVAEDRTEDTKEDWERMYNDLKKDYIDRFFGTRDLREEIEDIKEDTEDDVKRDGENQTFDELLKRVEG